MLIVKISRFMSFWDMTKFLFEIWVSVEMLEPISHSWGVSAVEYFLTNFEYKLSHECRQFKSIEKIQE